MTESMSGSEIRQSFVDFFKKKHGHTVVPSASLVPAEDATLLFTNSGMVQFVDVFLGTGQRKYSRAVNSQKCLRVAGKHNDLEEVGTDDTHHTFFEMLGSWSFGDYYKEEAITWAWELLTEEWGLPKERLYASVFRDEKAEIPTDEDAAKEWLARPGFVAEHLNYLGRKDNFWEMADTGPCGPNSEIHYDLGENYGDLTYMDDGQVDLDGPRFVELWNLVFIQYNRTGPKHLDPLPAMHVDTGMGFDRIVSVLQHTDSNYLTDLFRPIIESIRKLTGDSKQEMEEQFTPYRVIADHARAAAFLIADGVVPGNMGRNYVARMIIRRAARFGSKIGLTKPFMAEVANAVIKEYGGAYPELKKNAVSIRDNLQREEERFQRTLEGGLAHLDNLLGDISKKKKKVLDGESAFDLYATFGLPLEITRDIAKEQGLDVDDKGFQNAMENHRVASGAGETFAELGGKEAELYGELLKELQGSKSLGKAGVEYDPYSDLSTEGKLLAIVQDGKSKKSVSVGDQVDIVMPKSTFYIASGGQISDTGIIASANGKDWQIKISEVRRPAAGIVSHRGEVIQGEPKVGDRARAEVDASRRQDIIRNHTATHLLHAALHQEIGEHARQAGSLVAPDRLRFDFNHNEALKKQEIEAIETQVNNWILDNLRLTIEYKQLDQARKEGAIALFGEKYSDEVRTIQIGNGQAFSYELCGGTHVESTGEIGAFVIASEGSAAAGIRRIEALTGRAAHEYLNAQRRAASKVASNFGVSVEKIEQQSQTLVDELKNARKQLESHQAAQASGSFEDLMSNVAEVNSIPVLSARMDGLSASALRELADQFRENNPSGVLMLAGVNDNKASLIAAISKDLNKKGLKAGDLVKEIAEAIGGSGGGRPDLAEAGGKDIEKLDDALRLVEQWVERKSA
jgi:alanyl-tRNA synthetase